MEMLEQMLDGQGYLGWSYRGPERRPRAYKMHFQANLNSYRGLYSKNAQCALHSMKESPK